MDLPQIGKQLVHILLTLEGALLLLSVVVLHDEVGDGTKRPLPLKPPWLIATRLKTRRTEPKPT